MQNRHRTQIASGFLALSLVSIASTAARAANRPEDWPVRIERESHEYVVDADGRFLGAVTVDDVVAIAGKSIFEVQVVDVSKGVALQALSQTRGAAATIYFGDDLTDETAFQTLSDNPANVTVKVGDGNTAAAFRVADPQAVAETLTTLSGLLTR